MAIKVILAGGFVIIGVINGQIRMVVRFIRGIAFKLLFEPQAGELPVITALAGFIIAYQGGSGRNGAGLITGMGVEVLFIHQLVDKAEVNGILARITLLHAKTRGEALPVELHVHERALVGARGFQLFHLGRRLHEIHANVIQIHVAAAGGG